LLLQPLLPKNKTSHPAQYDLAVNVLRDTAGEVLPAISAMVNPIITQASQIQCSDSIVDNVYPLIYELHRISPGLLNNILPNLCVQLRNEDEEVRIPTTEIVGKLFASKQAQYAVDFSRNFRDYLGRASDVSADVRLLVTGTAGAIAANNPTLQKSILGKCIVGGV